jgi:hypothetical protein
VSLDEFCDAIIWLVILVGVALGLLVLAVVLVLGVLGRAIRDTARWMSEACR